MLFQDLVNAYDEIEARSSRLEMTEILADLLKRADKADLKKIVYLTQGQLYPDFDPRKLGLADRVPTRDSWLSKAERGGFEPPVPFARREYLAPCTLTVGEYLAQWLTGAKVNMAPQT